MRWASPARWSSAPARRRDARVAAAGPSAAPDPVSGRASAPRRRCRRQPAGPRPLRRIPPGRPGRDSARHRPVPGHGDRPAAGTSDRALPQLCPAGLGHHRAAQTTRLSGHPLQRRLGHRLRAGRADTAQGQALTERRGTSSRRTDHLSARQLHAGCTGDAAAVRPGPGAGGAGTRYNTCIRRGVIAMPDQLHRRVHRLVPPRQRRPGLQLQPDLRRLERDHQLRPAGAALSFSAREVKWVSRSVWWPGRWCCTSGTCRSSGCHSSSRTCGRAGTRASSSPSSASTTWCGPTARTTGRSATSVITGRPTTTSMSPRRLDWYSNRYVQPGSSGQYQLAQPIRRTDPSPYSRQ